MSFYRGNFKPKNTSNPSQDFILNTTKIVGVSQEGGEYRIQCDFGQSDGLVDSIFYTSDAYLGSTHNEPFNATARIVVNYVKVGNTEAAGTVHVKLADIICVRQSPTAGRLEIVTSSAIYEIESTLADYLTALSDASGSSGSSGSSDPSVIDLTVASDTNLLLAHEGNVLRLESATDINLTIQPQSSVEWSKVFTYVSQKGAGTITVTAGAGVTILTSAVKTPFQYGVITLMRASENTWNIIGGTV